MKNYDRIFYQVGDLWKLGRDAKKTFKAGVKKYLHIERYKWM